MKKKFFAIALAAVAAAGITISAQSADNNRQKGDKPCSKENCCAQQCQDGTPGDNNKMGRPQSFRDFAFEGILLDLNQQQRMDSLNAAVKADRDAKMAARKEKKDGEQKCDRQQMRDNMRQGRADYIAKVKEILTPEQYTMFLENIVLMPQQQAPGQKMGQPGMRHHGKDGMRSDRGRKDQRKDKAAVNKDQKSKNKTGKQSKNKKDNGKTE